MFNPKQFIKEQVEEIRNTVGDKKVVSATSGGVDSVACAAIANQAIGKQLKTFFIDDGLMRLNEGPTVISKLREQGIQIDLVDSADYFFGRLKGITDPEKKRMAFRDAFYTTFGNLVKKSGANFLLQGTIKADIEETKGGVKTQHNVLEQIGVSPKKYGFEVLEPLKTLYKPDVRKVCKELGLSKYFWNRQPFPGPGLATRCVGEVTPERIQKVRLAEAVVEKETEKYGAFQAFAVLLSDKATGVTQKKERLFGDIIVVRVIASTDALTAKPVKLSWDTMEKIRDGILREVTGVTRVLYDLTPKPPATIEYI
jgi:GMP synthase (glutamine-hydrolysing)